MRAIQLADRRKTLYNRAGLTYRTPERRKKMYGSCSGADVGTILRYGLNVRGIGTRFPTETTNLFRIHSVQTGSGAHSPPCLFGNGRFFPRGQSVRSVNVTTHSHLVQRQDGIKKNRSDQKQTERKHKRDKAIKYVQFTSIRPRGIILERRRNAGILSCSSQKPH